MSDIVLLDTTVYLNVLNVPGRNQQREEIFDSSVFAQWLNTFPDFAQRNKSPDKTTEGISLSDLSIIKEWEQTRDRHSMSRVLIWSLDSDLAAYDTGVR